MGKDLSERIKKSIRKKAHDWFERAIGGDTQERQRLRGRYVTSAGCVIVEQVSEVWAYCTRVQFRENRGGLIELAERICKDGDQETVATLVDGGMEYVARRRRSMHE